MKDLLNYWDYGIYLSRGDEISEDGQEKSNFKFIEGWIRPKITFAKQILQNIDWDPGGCNQDYMSVCAILRLKFTCIIKMGLAGMNLSGMCLRILEGCCVGLPCKVLTLRPLKELVEVGRILGAFHMNTAE